MTSFQKHRIKVSSHETEGGKTAPTMELARKIVALRKASGMNQEQLARALGLSRSAVAAMETGRTSSARKHIPALARIWQVPPELFLSGLIEKDTPMTLSPDEVDLVELYRQLPPEQKISVQKHIERQTRKL